CEKQLGETLQLASGLSNRLDEFSTFGAALLPLWKAAKSTRWLSPLYSFGFSQLMDCVREGLRQRQGGGGSQQSARVKDLTDSCLRATLTELSSRLGEAHFDALMLAFALERLLARGQVRPEQAALLLGRRTLSCLRLAMTSLLSWPSLSRLSRQSCPGLLDSLRRFEKLWLEYLGRPVVLAASPPGLNRLSVVEKCLLWKLLKPEAFSSVAQALVNHELGALQPARQPYSIRRLHDASPDPRQPLLLIRPASHRPMFLSPESAVNQLRAELRPRRLCTVYVGGLQRDWQAAVEGFNDCAENGGWLHLDLVAAE
uniref:Dynein_C domain-containing protein n=1 Tax=Macrostomum lignano TaxID=282301 RepID=A0A1I8HC10_9PLAT